MAIYLLLLMFAIATGTAIFYIRKTKQEYRDMAFKVDNFEEKIKEAHEKLANAISYQYSDVITRLDELWGSLESSDVVSFPNQYSRMSNEELYKLAKIAVIYGKVASASFLQRKFGLHYAKASLILDMLVEGGVISEGEGAKPRTVLLTKDDLPDEEKAEIDKLEQNDSDEDDLYLEAKQVVIEAGKASASLIQRRLRVGYARAARLLDILEEQGVIGPGEGVKPREVYGDISTKEGAQINTISFEFTKEGGLTESWTGGFELILNDRKTGDFLNEAGFILSAERDGLFPMFAGLCGQMGCCGTYVEVKHQDDKVIWEKFWHGGCSGEPEPEDALHEKEFFDDFVVKPPLVFTGEEYTATSAKLLLELKEMPDQYEYFLKRSERYKSGDVEEL